MYIIETQFIQMVANKWVRVWIGKDGKTVTPIAKARTFKTWGAAAAWSVNNGVADTTTIVVKDMTSAYKSIELARAEVVYPEEM